MGIVTSVLMFDNACSQMFLLLVVSLPERGSNHRLTKYFRVFMETAEGMHSWSCKFNKIIE
jgi:hypothetical protein